MPQEVSNHLAEGVLSHPPSGNSPRFPATLIVKKNFQLEPLAIPMVICYYPHPNNFPDFVKQMAIVCGGIYGRDLTLINSHATMSRREFKLNACSKFLEVITFPNFQAN